MSTTSLLPQDALKKLFDQLPGFGQTIVAWNQGLSGMIGTDSWLMTLIDAEEMLSGIVEYFCACTPTPLDFHPCEFHELGEIVLILTWNTVLDGDLQFGMNRQGTDKDYAARLERHYRLVKDAVAKGK